MAALAAGPVMAQDTSLAVQQFLPGPGGDQNFNHVYGSDTLGHLTPSFGLMVNYGYRPLTLTRNSTGESVDLINSQLQTDVFAAIGFMDRLQLGVAIPVTLYQAAGDASGTLVPGEISAQTMGDIRLVPKIKLLGGADSRIGLAALGILSLPTGDPAALQGNGFSTFEPKLALDLGLGDSAKLGLNVGYLLRQEQGLYNLTVGNEVTVGGGLAYDIKPSLTLMAEGFGRIAAGANAELVAQTVPFEMNVAARFRMNDVHSLTIGAGPGISRGYGTPTFRAFLGYAYTGAPGNRADSDGDGIMDKKDQCPNEAEDKDHFQDSDGCPDPDNDEDGLLDGDDSCPDEAEDHDGFQDEDGCLDPDDDGDGIMDADDQCKMDPEDKDGVADQDGCPETDADGDGLLDTVDKCPEKAEDRDQIMDEDGCPEVDADEDGLMDDVDKCPLEAEVINGVDDDDGCPDEGEAQVVVTEREIKILEKVYFDFAESTIQERSHHLLRQVFAVLRAHPEITKLRIEGHTDSVGSEDLNRDLSHRRALAVRNYLVEQGTDAKRFIAVGYGPSRPIADNATKAGRAKNRRVQFTIIEIGGKTVPEDDQVIRSGSKSTD